jgi:hypothetical protein
MIAYTRNRTLGLRGLSRTLKPRKESRSRPKGRAGGRAGGAGYDFQDVYVAHQLAKLLVGNDRDPLMRESAGPRWDRQ